MSNIITLKRQNPDRKAVLLYGRIEEANGEDYRLRLENDITLTALRASGCLLAPAPGDEVLVIDDGARAFILSVLTAGDDRARIVLPEACDLEGGEISLTGRQTLILKAPRVSLAGLLGEVQFKGLSVLSQWCDIRIRKIAAVAEVWDRVVGRLTERIRDSYRRIENTEQTTAGRIRTIVRGRFSLGAKNAALTAEEAVTVDGKKIHLG